MRSPHDCGLAYLDRRFNTGRTTPVRVNLSFWLWSPDYEGGSGGNVRGPGTRRNRLRHRSPPGPRWRSGHAEGPGWYNYRYQATVTPDSRGQVCVSQAIKLSSTTGADFKHYYIDDTKVTIS
nr:hypothetical protein [Kibdelosporangium sp. MJ126-NF4]CEL16549.1 hypothetical protein [Kibdelosporangium sp. MJ126-NF4]CTQ90502.1 hypothetical protein [Kibdelosporangium sp. MJ126-NF4]